MDRTLERVAVACVKECERQGVGLDRLGRLIEGMAYAQEHADRLPNEGDVVHLIGLIEPKTGGNYRDVPVTFDGGGIHGASVSVVASATARLFAHLHEEAFPDEAVRALLSIHPWIDGNGRVGFILLNWLKGTLADPEPLPDYFEAP